jgi:2-polyprenyl-6-hydroxyphenyl methylase/3-demethylubiquinone-9 3-methyltransferase
MEEHECTYSYGSADASHTASYLWPPVLNLLSEYTEDDASVFDLGCGNGAFAAELARRGYNVTGVDPSHDGIARARETHPGLDVHVGSAYDDLQSEYGTFDAVVSLEVVEHIYYPRKYAACVYDLLERGGVALISTPYHGYWKNLALALTGKMDEHFTALWTHGHIKFWSRDTLGQLLDEAGFANIQFRRVGRIPLLAKSMIAIAEKPSE